MSGNILSSEALTAFSDYIDRILPGLPVILRIVHLTLSLGFTTVFFAMMFNLIIAGFAGGLVPLALERFGFDPAIASSIFVTTFTDVGGFFSFLGLATLAMRYFPHH